ncbi:hypothetical protein M0P65_07110 [Candidatus Gracilibacteria bacterium]|nr:hypothetical protein [Candidatus Gracilibacteria bacterium]
MVEKLNEQKIKDKNNKINDKDPNNLFQDNKIGIYSSIYSLGGLIKTSTPSVNELLK